MILVRNCSHPKGIKLTAGRIAELADAFEQSGIKNPLLVTNHLSVTSVTLDVMEAVVVA